MTPSRAAFSLVELSVVLAIIAVIAAMGLDIGQNAIRGATRVSTQEKLALIKEALEAYAEHNGYLPCPANPRLLPSSSSFGLESRNTLPSVGCLAVSGGVIITSSVVYGMVPFANLGLDDSYATDAWGGKLMYAVSQNHTGIGNGLSSYAKDKGSITINSGTRASPITLTVDSDTGAPGAGATFAVVSFGPNQRGAFPLNGTSIGFTCGSDTTLIEVANCDRGDAILYDARYNEGSQNDTRFDDYIVWGANNTKRNPLTTVTSSCPSGCANWCASCEAARTSVAPTTATRVCAKFIIKSSPTCEAVCIWPNDTTPCP